MSTATRPRAAKTTHDSWKAQRKWARKPSQSPAQSRSWVDTTRPTLARIKYECALVDILFSNDYDESHLGADGIRVFSPNDSDNDVIQKLQQMQELCGMCGVTPGDELNQQTLVMLQTFGLGDSEPKKKLMVYLGTWKKQNAFALLSTSEEAICRVGLSELSQEGIYEIRRGELIDSASAVLELAKELDLEQPRLDVQQHGWQEQINTKIAQECKNAKLDFQMDKRVDKKMNKRGCEAAKWAAKLTLQERLPELLEEQDWINRRVVVDAANVKGDRLSYYNHLPIEEWLPPFDSEAKAKQYIKDFDVMAK